MRFVFPNYKKNILNISSTFDEMLGNENNNCKLKILKMALKKNYKNVVFIILDGFGVHPMKTNLSKNSFLRKHYRSKLTSVFPSTTTNATSTLMSAKYPMEHGWFGWSMFFDELGRAVNIYEAKDSYTFEKIDPSFVRKRLPFQPYYKSSVGYEINKVFPPFVQDGIELNNNVYNTKEEMFSLIKKCCEKDGKQFVYAYCGEPDATMHLQGMSSLQAKNVSNELSCLVEDLATNLSDSIIVVTADHGQVDIEGYLELFKNEELLDKLEWPPFLEPRAAAFKVKNGHNKDFVELFNKDYAKDFKLFAVDYLVKKGVFGKETNNRVLLADYIAVCKTNKQMVFSEKSTRYKGHHTSLTKEMFVPLIMIEKK